MVFRLRSLAKRCAASTALAAISVLPSFAGITMAITDATPKYNDSTAPCSNPNGAWPGCGVTAFISNSVATASTQFLQQATFGTQPLPGGTLDFNSSFENWKTNGGFLDWNLSTGAINGDLSLSVDVFRAKAYSNGGGLGPNPGGGIDVTVAYTPGAGDPTLAQLFWVQGLLINYRPGLPGNGSYNTSTVYDTLDTAEFSNIACQSLPNPNDGTVPNVPASGATPYCEPAYGFQYGPKNFYDAPVGPYPNGSFRGIALLATETSGPDGADLLTVYGGVSYGFDLYVTPEPGTWMLMLAGLAAVIVHQYRARRA